MQIATGYFAKATEYAKEGYALVSIARKMPWFLPNDLEVFTFLALAPPEDVLKLKDNPEEYSKRYAAEVLSKISPLVVFQELSKIAQKANKEKVVLLCYEKPERFCHRHLVAGWLSKALGQLFLEADLLKVNQMELF